MKKFFNDIKSFFKKKDKIKYLKNMFKHYISNNVLFYLYIFISFMLATVLRIITVGGVFEIKAYLLDLAIVLLLGSFGYLVKDSKRYIYFFVVIIFNSILCIINAVYYQFFLSYVSVTLIPAISQIGGVSDAVWTKVDYGSFIYLLGPILFILIYLRLKKNNYFKQRKENDKVLFRNTLIVSLIYCFILLITMSSSEIKRLDQQWNRENIVKTLGLYTYIVNDFIKGIEPKISGLFNFDESYRGFREFYLNKEKQSKNNYTGIFKGKNIIFIHMESVQTFLVDLKINGTYITPYMNKLIKNSKYYSNFYPQISIGTSSDTEFTLLTSLMPASSGTAFVSYADRTYDSLPKIFKEKGYYTFSAHGNNADYWNRRIMHKNLGYDKFYAKDSFEMDEWTYMGLTDKSFFKQMIEKLKVIDSENKNYFGTLITLTNHTPWANEPIYEHIKLTKTYSIKDENGKKVTKEAPWLEGSEIGRYLTAVHYADEALGMFIEEMEKNGLLDNTVIVLYGDHTAKLKIEDYNLLYNYDAKTESIKEPSDPTYIKYDKYDNFLNNKTPLIIYSGKTGIDFKGEEKNVMGMYDVLPTITNLFGTRYSRYALGHDYYSKNEHIAIFPNGNFITNKVYYNSTDDKFITLTDEAIDGEYIERLKKYTEERLSVSNSIFLHNLIKIDLESMNKEGVN